MKFLGGTDLRSLCDAVHRTGFFFKGNDGVDSASMTNNSLEK